MDDIDYTEINGVEASARVVPIEHLTPKECVECYDLGDMHFEIWERSCPRSFGLLFDVQGIDPPLYRRFSTVASARRAMYKLAWDFSLKKEALPRAVL